MISGMGAPLARRTRKITLEPIVIEGKVPAKPAAAGLPWKWILLALALGGGVYLLAKQSKKRRGRVRRPLAA